jgi:hypothetical protein
MVYYIVLVFGFVSEEHSSVRSFGYFVKALHADGSGRQISHGYDDHNEAVAHAEDLVMRGVMSDVLIIVNDHRQYIVRVFLGVQWFCEQQLHAQFPGWRHHHEILAEEASHASTIEPPPTDECVAPDVRLFNAEAA